jgi:mannosyltransferase
MVDASSTRIASVHAAKASGIADGKPAGLDRVRTSSVALGIGVATGTALVLGLIRLGAPSLWVDESFTARAVDGPYSDTVEGYHWLYYSIEKPWAFVAGTSEAALRLPSVLGAMLACALLVVLARRLFDSWVALSSGVFLAASPFVVMWAQQARGYTLMLALSLVSTLLLLHAFERGTRFAWGLYGLAFALVVVWHPVAGMLLAPSHAVLLHQRRERVLPHGLLAGAVVLAVGVPWAMQIAIRSTGEGVAMDWLEFPTAEVALHAVLDVSGAAGLGVLLAAIGMWVLRRDGRSELAAWLGVWAFAPFVVALLVSVVRPIYLDRYLIVAAPAFALLAGVAVMGVRMRLRAVLVAAVVVAMAAGLARWYGEAGGGNWRDEDWRSAVETVRARAAEADAVVVVPWSAAPAARYYGAPVTGVSTADAVWVLVWSEAEPRDIADAQRLALGFGDHMRAEKLEFGRRVSAQLWVRPR